MIERHSTQTQRLTISRRLAALCILSLTLIVSLTACSDKKDASATSESAPATAAQSSAQSSGQKTPMKADSLPSKGKVIKAMHAGGYTYMEMENAGQQFWVAATMMNVKRNDHVSWRDAAVMKNFKSSSLHRTFDEILFVSSATVQ